MSAFLKMKKLFLVFVGLALGIVIGRYLMAGIRPRSFLAVKNCEQCWQPNEIAGLLTAVGITKTPSLVPAVVEVVKETDKTIVIQHPFPKARIHYVILPKKDIKDLADLTIEDQAYVIDALAVTGQIVREQKLRNWHLTTNGPGYQSVRYLHFHLTAD